MKNEDKVGYALLGFIAGGFAGISSIFAFFLLNINPVFWFAFVVFVCAPAGAAIGWRNAEAVDGWGRR